MTTRREIRNTFPVNPHPSNPQNPGNIVKFGPGTYFNGCITVHDNGSFTVSEKAYVDDVVSFLSGAINSNPTISDDIKNLLKEFLNKMDERALLRHGYSGSDEKFYTWN